MLGEPSNPDPPSNELHKSAGREPDTAHSLDTTTLLLGLLPYSLLGPVHPPSWVTSEDAAMPVGKNKPGTNGPEVGLVQGEQRGKQIALRFSPLSLFTTLCYEILA